MLKNFNVYYLRIFDFRKKNNWLEMKPPFDYRKFKVSIALKKLLPIILYIHPVLFRLSR